MLYKYTTDLMRRENRELEAVYKTIIVESIINLDCALQEIQREDKTH